MTRQFSGRCALVTGAASGIGAATASALVVQGATVWCADVAYDRVTTAVAQITATGGTAHAVALDVTQEADWLAALAQIPALDLVVHAAGISAGTPLWDMPLAEWRLIHAVNLDGAFLAVQHGIRALRDRGGSITLVASASGIKAAPGAAAYSSSKVAVRMLAKTAAKECLNAKIPVRINTVSPAGVRTPMWSAQPFFREMVATLGSEDAAYAAMENTPGGSRFATPEQVAAAICYLSSDDASMITGADLVIDDGYTI